MSQPPAGREHDPRPPLPRALSTMLLAASSLRLGVTPRTGWATGYSHRLTRLFLSWVALDEFRPDKVVINPVVCRFLQRSESVYLHIRHKNLLPLPE